MLLFTTLMVGGVNGGRGSMRWVGGSKLGA